jgi:predicted enzyme related to lactoylglutathione lyase
LQPEEKRDAAKRSHVCTSQASQAFWDVDDVDQLIEQLKAKGVKFEDYDMPGERSAAGAITAGGAKAAWFKDSEGNIMALIQDLEK